MDTSTLLLHPRPPFSFRLACAYLQGSPGTILERVGPDYYARAVMLGGAPGVVIAEPAGDGRTELAVRLASPAAVGTAAGLAASTVSHVFQTARDVSGLETVGRNDPIVAGLIEECRGLRPILLPTPFEALVWAVLGQQVNVTFAAKTKRALAERYGTRVEVVDGATFLLFPTAESLAAARPEDMAALQLSRQKIRYITGLSQAVVSGRVDLDAFGKMAPEEAIEALTQLPGIGRWTAEYVLLRGFGHPDTIPAGDGGLRSVIGRAYLGRSATEQEVRDLAERWTGWRGYLAFYWWFRLQQQRLGAP